MKPGALATKQVTLTTLTTVSSRATDLTAAIAFRAQIAASSAPRSGEISAPTLPVSGSAPSMNGSWPDV